jgi:hypothetical protein
MIEPVSFGRKQSVWKVLLRTYQSLEVRHSMKKTMGFFLERDRPTEIWGVSFYTEMRS